MPYSADLRRQFRNRLSSDWEDLADALNMDGEIRRSIRENAPSKAWAVWDYLEVRRRLGELPGALREIGRDDLAEMLERGGDPDGGSPIPCRGTQQTPEVRPSPPGATETPGPTAGSKPTDPEPQLQEPAKPRNRKWKVNRLAVAIACGVVVSATAAFLIPLGGDDADPTPSAYCPAATPKVHGVTVEYPCEGDHVQPCVMVSGRSSLPSGKTMITAVRNADGSPTLYFQPVSEWNAPQNLRTWKSERYFGNAQNGIGQHYRLTVLVVDLGTANALVAAAGDELWAGDRMIDGEVAAVVNVQRSRTAGPSTC
jgi:hypothetical protein